MKHPGIVRAPYVEWPIYWAPPPKPPRRARLSRTPPEFVPHEILLVTPIDHYRELPPEVAARYVALAVEAVEQAYPKARVQHVAQAAVRFRADFPPQGVWLDLGDDFDATYIRDHIEAILGAAWAEATR